ncbi:MAG: helix-turn-helix domain-containing protein, partial [Acidimicrobiia bacterium]
MTTATAPPSTSGDMLRRWRTTRRMSQLDLSSAAGVSQRHLSFLETGRAKASREMILHLANELDVPLREQNVWLRAAGFSDAYSEHGIDEPIMDQVRHVLQSLLDAHDPFPAYVVDRRWTLVMTNGPATMLMSAVIDPANAPIFGGNILKLMLHPKGMREPMTNWHEAASAMYSRFLKELAERPGDASLEELAAEVRTYPGVDELALDPSPSPTDLVIPMNLSTPIGELSFITTIATLGAAYDVTLEELRL